MALGGVPLRFPLDSNVRHIPKACQVASLVTHPFKFLRAATLILHLFQKKTPISMVVNTCRSRVLWCQWLEQIQQCYTKPPNQTTTTTTKALMKKTITFQVLDYLLLPFFISNVTLTSPPQKKKRLKIWRYGVRQKITAKSKQTHIPSWVKVGSKPVEREDSIMTVTFFP